MTTHHINLYPPDNENKAVMWPRSDSHTRTKNAMKTNQPQPEIFEFRLNGMLDPSWSLNIIQTILHKEEQPDQWHSGIEELMRLILRIYTSPIVDNEIKNEALDTFDLLMRQYAGTANKILSEWDRR